MEKLKVYIVLSFLFALNTDIYSQDSDLDSYYSNQFYHSSYVQSSFFISHYNPTPFQSNLFNATFHFDTTNIVVLPDSLSETFIKGGFGNYNTEQILLEHHQRLKLGSFHIIGGNAKSDGAYRNSGFSHKKFRGALLIDQDRFNANIYFDWNKLNQQINGGILLDTNLYDVDLNYHESYLQDANLALADISYSGLFSYKINNDSLSKITIEDSISFRALSRTYSDIDTSYYDYSYFGEQTYDKVYSGLFMNYFGFGFTKSNFRLSIGVLSTYSEYNHKSWANKKSQNNGLYAHFGYNKNGTMANVSAEAAFINNQPLVNINLSLLKKADGNTRYGVTAGFLNVERMNDVVQYNSNRIFFDNLDMKSSYAYSNLFISKGVFEVGSSIKMFDKAPLIDTNLVLTYSNNIFSLSPYVMLRYKNEKWKLSGEFKYNYINEEALDLPSLQMRSFIGKYVSLFKDNMRLLTGIRAIYFSEYSLPKYIAPLNYYSTSTGLPGGNTILIDGVVEMEINTATIYFNIYHINAGLLNQSNLIAKDYYMIGRYFKVGLKWRMFN